MNQRIRLLTAQSERHIDELIHEIKQLKNRLGSLELDIRAKNES